MCKIEILEELGLADKIVATSNNKNEMKKNNNKIVQGIVIRKEQGFGDERL